jgi:hypothetical protein
MTISSKFEHGTGYIWQPVEAPNLPETISVEGLTLLKKSEYHVSLAYVQHLLASEPEIEIKVFESLLAFNEKSEVSFLKYTGEFRFAQDGERKTVVALCEVSNLEAFRNHMKAKLGIDLPPQPTHVTIYTLQPEVGIGLNSPAVMEDKSTPIEVPASVKEAMEIV